MTSATTALGPTIRLGMMRWSRSMNVTGTSVSTSAIPSQASSSAPLATTTRAHSTPVSASTSG